MAVAVLNEDYKEASRLRDALKLLEDEEPALRLQSLLKKAISEERFEDATKYRNELELIAPDALLKCFSDTTTFGIRVQVRSIYICSKIRPLQWESVVTFLSPSLKRFSHRVESGRTVEITIAQFWSSGNGSLATTLVDLE
ncbi:hypothetical protein KI387_037394, partial [Taxus chinensis]